MNYFSYQKLLNSIEKAFQWLVIIKTKVIYIYVATVPYYTKYTYILDEDFKTSPDYVDATDQESA
jgi:hypothetical protein